MSATEEKCGLKRRLRRLARKVPPYILPASLLVTRARTLLPQVALTFDDGPDAVRTPQLLDILARCEATATFFFVGRQAEAYPGLVREALARGHQVSNHGYDHDVTPAAGWPAFRDNIRRGEEILMRASVEVAERRFRPPRGAFPLRLLPWALFSRRTVVLWSLDSRDSFTDDAADILGAVAPEGVRPGDIILLHEDRPVTLELLPQMIARLRDAGFELGHEMTLGSLTPPG